MTAVAAEKGIPITVHKYGVTIIENFWLHEL